MRTMAPSPSSRDNLHPLALIVTVTLHESWHLTRRSKRLGNVTFLVDVETEIVINLVEEVSRGLHFSLLSLLRSRRFLRRFLRRKRSNNSNLNFSNLKSVSR